MLEIIAMSNCYAAIVKKLIRNCPSILERRNWFMKPLSKVHLLAPMLLGILLLSTDVVIAQVWTGIGSTFVPDEVSAKRYDAIDAQFRHKGSNINFVIGRCNVTNPMDDGSNPDPELFLLEVVYMAPPGVYFFGRPPLQLDKYTVRVKLVQVSNVSGGLTSVVATFASEGFPKDANFQTQSVSFVHTFDFYSNAYFVEISIFRKDTLGSPAVAIVRLKPEPLD